MEIDHWKFPRQGIPLGMKPSLSLSDHLPPFLCFFLVSFITDSVPLIKCCYIHREGFAFFLLCHARRLGAYHMTS